MEKGTSMSSVQPIQLAQDQIDHFRNEGYLVVNNLLTQKEVDDFLEDQSRPKPPELEKGLLKHTVDPQWGYLAKHPNVAGVAAQLLDGTSRIVQTMYMRKDAAGEEEVGGAGISLHQDTHYLPTEPNTLMACWIAMSDTDPDNGGLCVVPGSNLKPLRSTHMNEDEKEHASWEMDYDMRDRNGREWVQRFYSFKVDDLDQDNILQLTVPRGGGVFFTGMTIHGSYANRSKDRPRLAFAVHYVKDGTWVTRRDVQDTQEVDSYSTLAS